MNGGMDGGMSGGMDGVVGESELGASFANIGIYSPNTGEPPEGGYMAFGGQQNNQFNPQDHQGSVVLGMGGMDGGMGIPGLDMSQLSSAIPQVR